MSEELKDQEIDNIDTTVEDSSVNQGNESAENLVNDNDAEQSEMSILKNELDQAKDKYLRLFAEFENYKKRTSKERIELLGTAAKETLVALLPIADDFERAKKASDAGSEVFSEGVNLVYNKFFATLQNKGLKVMESNGEVFDSEKHEAITEIPAPNPEMVGKVIDTVEKGYYLNDKIVRYAKVVVGK